MFAKVSDADFAWLSRWKWHATKRRRTWYAARTERRKDGSRAAVYMHRLVSGSKSSERADHRNWDGLDNRRRNVRAATPQQNGANSRPKTGSSRFKGVHRHALTGKWRAMICCGGRSIHIGLFLSQRDAAVAYNSMAKNKFGRFAALNQV